MRKVFTVLAATSLLGILPDGAIAQICYGPTCETQHDELAQCRDQCFNAYMYQASRCGVFQTLAQATICYAEAADDLGRCNAACVSG